MREPSSFLKALAGTKPGPCLLCCHFDRCAKKKLACRDFQRYSNFKTIQRVDVDRYPNAKIYAHIFETEDRPYGRMC